MKKTEQQLADELDAFLTAALRGEQPTDVDEALQAEAKAAANLMQLAATQEPDPAFVAELEERLKEEAAVSSRRRKKVMVKPERPSFWQKLQQLVKDGFEMKRVTYGLGAVAALAVVVLIGLFVFGDRGNGVEPGVSVADVTAEPGDDAPVEVADLPTLPALDAGTSGGALGLGGGAAAEATALPPMGGGAADMMIMPEFTDIFSGTQFVLNTTLPTDVSEATVQRQEAFTMDEATAQELATMFGFEGQLYRQYQRPYPAETGIANDFEMPVAYFVFDGSRILTMDAYGVYYRDDSIEYDFENPLPFAEAQAIAETFLQARNLLTFPYVVEQGWGSDVMFKRLIDGRPLNQPEITVTVNNDGQIAFVGYNVLTRLETLGTYPLRSAEEAWALIQEGVTANNILFNWLPQPEAEQAAVSEPIMVEDMDEFRFWQREHQPGAEINLYGWPSIYLPVAEGGLPRIEMYPYILEGTAEQLQGIVDTEDGMIYVHGTLSADGQTLSIIDWEYMAQQEPLFLEGVIRRDGEQVQLVTTERETYILPNAPADLEDGTSVFVFSWAARDTGAEAPVLDWENIEKRVERPAEEEMMPVEPMPLPEPIEEPGFLGPYVYEEMTIDSVTLGFYYMPIFPEVEAEGDAADTSMMRMPSGPPTIVLMPVWQFQGTADNGDRLELVVNAVAPEYLEATE